MIEEYKKKLFEAAGIGDIDKSIAEGKKRIEEVENIEKSLMNKQAMIRAKLLNYSMPAVQPKGLFGRIRSLFRNRKKDGQEKEKLENELKEVNIELNKARAKTKEEMHKVQSERTKKEKIKDNFTTEEILKKNPKMRNNVEFMKEAIQEDLTFIKYDETNDKELYKEAVDIYTKKFEAKHSGDRFDVNKTQRDIRDRIIEELDNPKQVEEGKAKLDSKYFYEELRKNISAKTEAGFETTLSQDYLECDGFFDKEVVEKIENMFKDEDNYMFWHNIHHGQSFNVDDIETVFETGVYHSNSVNDIDRVITGKNTETNFLTLLHSLRYENTNENNDVFLKNSGFTPVILKIPKEAFDKNNEIGVFGCDSNKPREKDEFFTSFILPEYVEGVILPKRDGHIVFKENDIPKENRKKYKYHFKDKSKTAIEDRNKDEREEK